MLNNRFSLSGGDVVAVFAGLALLSAMNFGAIWVSSFEDVALDEPPVSSPSSDMPTVMQSQYEQWDRNANSVSVFARGKTSFGWVFGYLDEDVARADAMAWCTRSGKGCRVVEMRDARSVVSDLGLPLTDKMAVGFERFRNTPGPVSFAVSGTGAYAAGCGIMARLADKAALLRCGQFAAKDRGHIWPSIHAASLRAASRSVPTGRPAQPPAAWMQPWRN